VPWAEPHSRFTLLFERLAIDVLRECDVLGATRLLRISWDEAWAILERAVERGQLAKQARVIARLGVDEKSIAKGHKYFTLVSDVERGTVEYVGDHRRQESLDAFYAGLTPKQLAGIEAVAMDMWDPCFQSTMAHVPKAAEKIVFDRCHIMAHMGKAVDDVRKREHRALRAEGDETLTGTKYLWLYREENVPEKHRERFIDLRKAHLKTARAWAMKENLRDLWECRYRSWAESFWEGWYFWATHSRLEPVIKVAKMVQSHLPNILTYYTHRITNAVSEGLNSKIQGIKKMACGFRNQQHFKTAIYFHCGGLQLYPVHVPVG
jgi:transposase